MTSMEALRLFFHTALGQGVLSFFRMFAATVAAGWANAGFPVFDLRPDMLQLWIELGIQAGGALVIANYFGPWEKRYGVSKSRGEVSGDTPT